jgi:hypothetical protein
MVSQRLKTSLFSQQAIDDESLFSFTEFIEFRTYLNQARVLIN